MPPPPPPPPLPATFATVSENPGAMDFLPTTYPPSIHNGHLVSTLTPYPNQPGLIHNCNIGLVSQSHSVAHPNPQRKHGNKLCGRQDNNFAANSPCRCSKHLTTPSPPAYHVRTVIGERSLETSSGCQYVPVPRLRVCPPCCQLGQTRCYPTTCFTKPGYLS